MKIERTSPSDLAVTDLDQEDLYLILKVLRKIKTGEGAGLATCVAAGRIRDRIWEALEDADITL